MPRRNKVTPGGSLAILFIFLFIFMMAYIDYVGLIVAGTAFCLFLYFALRCAFLPNKLSIEYLYPEANAQQYGQIASRIHVLKQSVELVKEKGIGLDTKPDGSFDGRDARGRRLNKKIAELNCQLEKAREERQPLWDYAHSRFRTWSFNRAGRLASGIVFLAYVGWANTATSGLPEGIDGIVLLAFASGAAPLVCGGVSWLIAKRKQLSEYEAFRFEYKLVDRAEDFIDFRMLVQPGDYVRVRSPSDGRPYTANISEMSGTKITVDYDGEWTGDSEIITFADVIEVLPPKNEAGNQRNSGPYDNYAQRTCYEVLGISPDASVAEIKTAWRNAVKQYHPDHVAGLGPEFKALAEQKTQELNAAYAEALQQARSAA